MSRNCDGPLKIIIQVFMLTKKNIKKFDENLSGLWESMI